MRFTLQIDLGNADMRTYDDIAAALRDLADRMRYWGTPEPGEGNSIRDENGNRAGSWEIKRTRKAR